MRKETHKRAPERTRTHMHTNKQFKGEDAKHPKLHGTHKSKHALSDHTQYLEV